MKSDLIKNVKVEVKVIDSQLYRLGNNVHYTFICRLNVDNGAISRSSILKFTIKSPSSRISEDGLAKFSIWDGSDWKEMYSLHSSHMQTPVITMEASTCEELYENFISDRNRLFKVAKRFLKGIF